MRIALVCPYAWDRVGGVQSHVRALATALRRRDHHVNVIAPVSLRASRPGDITVAGRALGLPANGSIAPIAPGPGSAAAVRAALKAFAPDVVHVHEPLSPSTSMYAVLAAPAPVVGTFHSASEGRHLYGAFGPVLRPLVRRFAVRTGVSEAAIALASRHFPGHYELTPNGVDVDRFSGAGSMDLGPGPRVLFLGRVEPRKGLDVLIRAMAQLADLDASLIVAGTGPKEEECRGLARRLGVYGRWLGRLDEDTLPLVYRSADVYCHPARGRESFGIVLLEAMAAGTPVVCSELPGFRTAAGDAAAFVPPGDQMALGDALRKVLTSEAERRTLTDRAASRVARFDWDVLSEDVVRIYERARGEDTRTRL